MNAHSLSFLLRQYGILSAMHATHCAQMQYGATLLAPDLPACTCGLDEIRAEVKKQLSDMPQGETR